MTGVYIIIGVVDHEGITVIGAAHTMDEAKALAADFAASEQHKLLHEWAGYEDQAVVAVHPITSNADYWFNQIHTQRVTIGAQLGAGQ